MEIQLDILSEDLNDREISALRLELLETLENVPQVDMVKPVQEPAPAGQKGGLVDALGSLLIAIPVEAITGVLSIIKAIASRPGQPPVVFKISRDSVEVTFDPRSIAPDEVAALAEQLRPKG
ncbi:hypothetical protein [Caballeronia zhejiangensis]|jgi:hypothetical protein|uniref:hypothetical protein n=1 Tax=Caballeronia zhejiangensis TaxID=871203 RepID=UPI001FD5D610|nr:hypothetical protein [Caballeronia zhejiangensis]